MSRSLFRFLLALTAVVAATPGRAQFESIEIDAGRFGFDTLARLAPNLYYRPFDMLGTRPDARALGMGSAYIAMADDPMAIGWTPSGIAMLEDFTLAVDGLNRSSSDTATGFPRVLQIPQSPELAISSYDSRLKSQTLYGSIAAGVPLIQRGSLKFVGGFSWRRYADVARAEETVQDFLLDQGGGFPVTVADDSKERGSVEAFGPTLALQVAPGISVGGTANFLTGRSRLTASTRVNTGGGGSPPPSTERFTQKYDGFSMDLGATVRLGDRLRLAGRLTPEYTLDVTGGSYEVVSSTGVGTSTIRVFGTLSGYELTIPSLLSLGAAIKPIDRLWLTADYVSQKMGDTGVVYTGAAAQSFQDVDVNWLTFENGPIPDAPGPEVPYADLTQLSFGAEYVLFDKSWGKIPVRFGYRSTELPYLAADSLDYSYRYAHVEAAEDGLPVDELSAFAVAQTIGVRYNGPNGQQPDGTGYSFGASFETDRVTYDLGVDVFSYEETEFYGDSVWDAIFNPNPDEGRRILYDDKGTPITPLGQHPNVVSLDRTVTTIRFSATYNFPGLF